ncbi:MAG: hypothetical protein KIT24_12630 [Phycisphaeraceae bacterium]|nr:hypothetical protein [Phycisphaeraceae bacterium]
MNRLLAHADLRSWLADRAIADTSSLIAWLDAHVAERANPDGERGETRIWILSEPPSETHPGFTVYVKCYEYPRPSLKFVLRASKARCEYRNALAFQRLGIRTAEPLAWGEERDRIGRLKRAVIVTRAIPGAQPLDAIHPSRALNLAKRSVIRQLAEMTAALHRAGRVHHDLHWRNVLVQTEQDNAPVVWWIDCPRGRRVLLPSRRTRGMVRDCACLARTAITRASPIDRLRLLVCYFRAIGRNRRRDRRQMLMAMESYRTRKWPQDNPQKGN